VVRKPIALAIALAALLATTSEGAPVAPEDRPVLQRRPPAGLTGRYVIGAAGDIACPSDPNGPSSPETCQYDDTGDLIHRTGLAQVLALGDNQYDSGAYRDYLAYFDPTWGRAFASLSPVPGNHEYPNGPSSRPRGYFRYFGDRVKGPNRLGYYSFDLGACPDDPCWHLIALNSMLCFASGGCGPAADPSDPGPGNRMYRWLGRDLANHPDADYPCTLAYWHHPLFSFSTGSGPSAAVRPLWRLLYEAGADVVLNGHSHNYQRWRPQDPLGTLDAERGIREFVVGTGGANHYAISGGEWPPNLVVGQADSFGVLRIVLRAEAYRWGWVTAAGQPTFSDTPDRGVRCVRLDP
jgi:acid phosphatase type 7